MIIDGFTEQTFGVATPGLQEVLAEDFELVREYEGSEYPVRMYRLIRLSPAPSP